MILKIGENLSFDKLCEIIAERSPLINRTEIEGLTISALQRRRLPCVLRLLKSEDITEDLVGAVIQEKDVIARLRKSAEKLEDPFMLMHVMSQADGVLVGMQNPAFERLLEILAPQIIVERSAIEEHVDTLLNDHSRIDRKPASQLEDSDLTEEFIEKVIKLHKITSPYAKFDPSKV